MASHPLIKLTFRLFSLSCITIGITFLVSALYLFYQIHDPNRLKFNSLPQTTTNQSASFPTKITIEPLDIDLPIIPTPSGAPGWPSTTLGVSYLSRSPIPGSVGNSIIYGHNWASLLGRLPEAKPGQLITIHYQNGQTHQFQIQYTAQVSPEDISIIQPSLDQRLTIYTCAGFLDSQRFVAVATLI